MNLAFEISRQTMLQTQTAMGIATNNIANQTVEGYTRQRVNLESNLPILNGGHLVGTGANISSIDRIRTGFYDRQYRDNLGIYSNSNTYLTAYSRIESILGSLDGDTGLKTSLNGLFSSLEELSKNTEAIGIKQVLRDSASTVVNSFNLISHNLKTTKEQYSGHTKSKVEIINNTLKNLQQVNDEIGRLSARGQNPNELLDERDRLIDSLSADMDITTIATENNKINVISNGRVLVQDMHSSSLKFTTNIDGSISVNYEDGGDFKSTGGELSALIDIVNVAIPKYNERINLFAKDFIDSFNLVHRTGVAKDGTTDLDFFEGDTASNIKIKDSILNDASLIMNSTDGTSGNNDVILKLINLKNEKTIDNGKFNTIEYFDNIASSISTETNYMKTKTANYEYIKNEIYVFRSNEVGVNEDEEILSSVKLQQTFSAVSKIISTLDEMFDSLINAL